MIFDPNEIVEKIIVELKEISNEAVITKALLTPEDERQTPNSFIELLQLIKQEGEEMMRLKNTMTYLEGKMDAYMRVLELLGFGSQNEKI